MKNRKTKRLMSLFLVLTMIMTLFMGVQLASAAGQVPVDLIDKDRDDCSIKVHKYVTTSDVEPTDSTGTTNDATNVTDAYKPLKDAEFKLYKIADADDVMKYYNGNDGSAYDIGLFVYNDGAPKYNDELLDDEALIGTLTTDTDGTCSFTDLAVGIYVLVESSAPDYVNTPLSAPCMISVPMVNTKTSDNDNEWLYEINVYPKNYDYATLDLTKQDDNGTALEGVTFELYSKTIDSTGNLAADWTKVETTKKTDGTDNPLTLTTDENGKLVLTGLTSGQYNTQYKLIETSSVNSYIINKHPLYFVVNHDNTITYNEKVASATYSEIKDDSDNVIGYDYVNGAGKYVNNNHDVTATSTITYPPTLYVTLRNARPYLEKKVLENSDTTNWVSSTQYNMTDVINYQIVSYVPKNIAEIGYTIIDTPSVGITDTAVATEGNYVVKYATSLTPVTDWSTLTWTDLAADYYTLTQVAAVDGTSGQGFKFEIITKDDDGNLIENPAAGMYVKIEYKAGLNEKAVIAGDGNLNTISLEYSKYIGGKDPDTFKITDEAVVYTYEFEITKYKNSVSDANKLTAADPSADPVVFNLYKNTGSTKMDVVKVEDGVYRLPVAGDNTTSFTKDLVLGANGTITVKGLENDTYYLEEIDTIKGYNLLSDKVEIVINNIATTTWAADTQYTTDGRVVRDYDSTSYNTGDDTTVKENIINKKGFVLPQTGSAGFLAFCAVGIVLILGGAMLIFGGRKKKIQ